MTVGLIAWVPKVATMRTVPSGGLATVARAAFAPAFPGISSTWTGRSKTCANSGTSARARSSEALRAADAHVRIVDVAAEHGLVVPQRQLVIAAPARVLGEQVVSAQRVRVVEREDRQVRQRGVELAALLVALGEHGAQRRGPLGRHFRHAQQLLGPLDREPLVARFP